MASLTDTGKKYWSKCSGEAFETVDKHTHDQDITLFASCFCPFVQRVWIALEALGITYKYYEVDPYKKPHDLLQVSPRGLVPALRISGEKGQKFDPPRSLNESTVILEYLLSLSGSMYNLFPKASRPYAQALVRLQADHVNRALIPAFYRFLQAEGTEKQIATGKEFDAALNTFIHLLERAEREVGGDPEVGGDLGLWMADGRLGWVDLMAGPWLFRTKLVLSYYRGYQFPSSEKLSAYLDRLFAHPVFKRTISTDQLYIDSYERYAFNRPNTSLVASAINEGRALP